MEELWCADKVQHTGKVQYLEGSHSMSLPEHVHLGQANEQGVLVEEALIDYLLDCQELGGGGESKKE